MSNRTQTRLLILIVIIYLLVGIVSWFGRAFLFNWGQADSAPDFMVFLMWIGLILALLVLGAVIVMRLLSLERTKKYIMLLFLSGFLVVMSLFGEFGWLIAHYGIPSFIALTNIGVSYKPPLLPITFMIDTQGNISLEGDLSIVTLVGTFSLDTGISNLPQPQEKVLLLIIKHRHNGSLVNAVYKIQTSQEKVVVITNGITRIEASRGEVVIDASGGNIKSIQVEGVVSR